VPFRTGTAYYHKISGRQFATDHAKVLPDQSLDPVSLYRSFGAFFGNRQSQAGFPQFVGPGQDQKAGSRLFNRQIKYPLEISRLEQAYPFGKTTGRYRQWQPLGRQTGTALGTTRIQNLAAIAGGHAGTETVGTGTLENTGLECTFHDETLLKSRVQRAGQSKLKPIKGQGKLSRK
jgi:hypothetical protein